MRRFIKYLQTYEGITAIIAFILSTLEVFLYKGVFFIYSYSKVLLLVTSITSIACYIILRQYTKRIVNSIMTVSIVLCVVTISMSIYDYFSGKQHNQSIEEAQLIRKSFYCYDATTSMVASKDYQLSEHILENIIYRHDTVSHDRVISRLNSNDSTVRWGYMSEGDYIIYFSESSVLNPDANKDKSNIAMPEFTHQTILGIKEFEDENWNQAKNHFESSNLDDDPVSCYFLYLIHNNGLGVEVDQESANTYLYSSARNGLISAKYQLAHDLLNSNSRNDLIVAEDLLLEILEFKPTFVFIYETYMAEFKRAFKDLMELYNIFNSPIKGYKVSKKLLKIHKNTPLYNYLIIEHALNCYKCNKLKKTRKYISTGLDLNIPIAYYYGAQILSEQNKHGENDEQIHALLTYAALKLNHQESRLKLIEYYKSHGHKELANIWSKIYEIEYSNLIEE